MADYDYGQLIDDFELGVDVMPDEDLTAYIERRRREFESKADGGSIGIEVLFQPKRGEYQTGGKAIDSRASAVEYAEALQKVSGGTQAQKRQDLSNYLGNLISAGGQKIGNALTIPYQAAKGVLGIQGTPITDSMQASLQNIIQKQIKDSGKLSGNINYKDYGVKTNTQGNEFIGFGDRSFTDPEAALATTLGQASYSVDPKTGKITFTGGTAYDFRDDQFGGLGKFISKGGVFNQLPSPSNNFQAGATEYNPDITLGSDFMKQFNQPQYPDYKTAALQSQYYKNNPSSLDSDLFRAAYARAVPDSGIKTRITNEGQVYTDYGNYDPSRVYSAYMSNTGTSSSNPFFDQFKGSQYADMPAIMKAMYGDPGNLNPYYADGGRVRAVSGGFLKLLAEGTAKGKKGIMELVESGKGRFDEFVETMNQSKKPSDSFTAQNITADLIDGPITIEKMANLDSKTLNIIKNTYDQGLYKEMPEILKAGNLLERFTKVVKGKRIVDYERAESILGVPLKGDETLNEIFKIEFDTRPVEKLADGGRVGLFMGGDPLTGQALSIYDSMKAYNFSDQEIANALSAQGLYTAPGSSTPETTAPNIINQQLQTGGGGDNNFGGQGIGAFGNLDPNTKQTMQVEVADGMGGVTIKEVDTYLDAGGLRKTLDNKNPVNLGLDIKPMAVTIMEALMGKKTDDEFDPEGKIYGTFNNPNYKDMSFLGKIKADYSRKKELKQLQKEFEKQEKLKEQIRQEAIANANKPYSGPTFYNTRDDGSRGSAISQDFKNTTASLDNYSADVLYKDGGLATMFTRRR